MRWTRKGIIEEIRRLHAAGEELNYKAVEENHLNLVRAASWHFGTWKRAIEKSGLDYDDVSKYQKWSRERVVARIKELYNEGKDLSWRAISTEVDPPLAAAALRENSGFESWYEAITAAGLNHDEIARYRRWTKERVLQEILDRNKNGLPMSSIAVQRHNSPLYCAAKRRFLQWDNALRTAGLDPDKIRIRKAPEAAQPRRRRSAAAQLLDTPAPVAVGRPGRRRKGDAPTLDQAVAALQAESNGAPEIAPISEKPRRGRKPVVPAEIVAPIVETPVATNGTAPKGKKSAAKAAPPVVETPVAPTKPARGRKAAPAPEPVVEEAPVKPARGRKAAPAPAPVVEEAPKPTRGRKAAAAPVVEAPVAPAKPARGKAAAAPAPAAIAATAKGKKSAAVATPEPAPAKAPAKKTAKAAPIVEVPAEPVKPARGRKAAAAPVVEEAPAKPARKTVAKAAPAPAAKAAPAKAAPAKAPAKAAVKAAPAAKPATAKAAKAAPAPEPTVAAKPARGKAAKVEAPTPAPAKKAKAEKAQAAAPVVEKKAKKEPKAEPAKKPKEVKAKKKK